MGGKVAPLKTAFAITTFFTISCLGIELPPAIMEGAIINPMGCQQRMYTYRISQEDSNGKECWDNVSVMSCWGRCVSSEISDWKFPYKKSNHPVCVHHQREKVVTFLKNCDPDASIEASRYEYLEAKSCHCQQCSTSDTSCEGPSIHLGSSDMSPRVMQLHGAGEELEY